MDTWTTRYQVMRSVALRHTHVKEYRLLVLSQTVRKNGQRAQHFSLHAEYGPIGKVNRLHFYCDAGNQFACNDKYRELEDKKTRQGYWTFSRPAIAHAVPSLAHLGFEPVSKYSKLTQADYETRVDAYLGALDAPLRDALGKARKKVMKSLAERMRASLEPRQLASAWPVVELAVAEAALAEQFYVEGVLTRVSSDKSALELPRLSSGLQQLLAEDGQDEDYEAAIQRLVSVLHDRPFVANP